MKGKATRSSPPAIEPPFWQTTPLEEMSPEQWESLCDGCARCCLHKLHDEESDRIYFTRVACRHLDLERCRCRCYEERLREVPDCLLLTPQNAATMLGLPPTCAYRLLAEGKELFWWHPLRSGDRQTVHRAGFSVRQKVISEDYVHPEEWWELLLDVDIVGRIVPFPRDDLP